MIDAQLYWPPRFHLAKKDCSGINLINYIYKVFQVTKKGFNTILYQNEHSRCLFSGKYFVMSGRLWLGSVRVRQKKLFIRTDLS